MIEFFILKFNNSLTITICRISYMFKKQHQNFTNGLNKKNNFE